MQKALGKDSEVCRKAAAAPRAAQVLEQGCWPDQPIFCDLSKGHYTLRWVMGRLFQCLIRKNGEGKGVAERSRQRGCQALATGAGRSHVPAGGEC